jgi:ParB-like chromosome segregation protein Spo0J
MKDEERGRQAGKPAPQPALAYCLLRPMKIRDRIKDLRRVPASQLRPNPKNWRVHPQSQQDALRGVLAEIGYADALLVRELPDGSLELIDGHLRAETTPDQEVPVLVLDVDDQEAAKLLALLDPLAGLAETNEDALAELLAGVETESEAVQKVLDELLASPDLDLQDSGETPPEVVIPEVFQVVVECRDESDQRDVFERLTAEGLKCKLLTL